MVVLVAEPDREQHLTDTFNRDLAQDWIFDLQIFVCDYVEEVLKLLLLYAVHDHPVNDAFDGNHLFAFVVFVVTDFFPEDLFEELAVVDHDVLVDNTDQADALECDEKILFVREICHSRVDKCLANADQVAAVHVYLAATFEQASAKDESALRREFLLKVSLFDKLY